MFNPGDIVYHIPDGARGTVLRWTEWLPKYLEDWGETHSPPIPSVIHYDGLVLVEFDIPVMVNPPACHRTWGMMPNNLEKDELESLLPRLIELMNAP